jgi:glycosyltransferase involved in cell wall biosynthesis
MFEVAACVYNVPEYLQVRRAISTLRPDFVYARHGRFGIGAALAARHCGVPLALEVNCLFADPLYQQFEPLGLRRVGSGLEGLALRAARVVLAVSSPLADRIRRMVATRVMVLPNGVDPTRFNPANADGAAVRIRLGLGESCVAGWVGILRTWHGLDLLLESVAHVDGVTLLLVGDGPARLAVQAHAASLGITNRVVVTGRVPHDEIRAYIAAMDIAVVADERTGVASPMKLLEYMAMGRAVVAPDLPNIRDVIRPQSEGLLFRQGDVDALAAALGTLAADVALRNRLGTQASTRVLRERTWEQNARAVIGAMMHD